MYKAVLGGQKNYLIPPHFSCHLSFWFLSRPFHLEYLPSCSKTEYKPGNICFKNYKSPDLVKYLLSHWCWSSFPSTIHGHIARKQFFLSIIHKSVLSSNNSLYVEMIVDKKPILSDNLLTLGSDLSSIHKGKRIYSLEESKTVTSCEFCFARSNK